MNSKLVTTSQINLALTMASLEMAGLAEKRHDSVKRTIDTLVVRGAISQPQIVDGMKSANGVVEQVYLVGKRDSYVVMAQLSPEFTARLVDRWQELEAKAAAPAAPTTASMFFQSAQIMLEMESRTAALEKQQITMQARLDEVVKNNVLKVCPQNAESITYIRKRINKMFGLSASVIDEAMRQLPYSPKPAGMVLNDNEAAQGSHYAVFWVKDVTTMFKRFVAECQRETTAFASHPFIESRFKLKQEVR